VRECRRICRNNQGEKKSALFRWPFGGSRVPGTLFQNSESICANVLALERDIRK
jgi:hypothetical protein